MSTLTPPKGSFHSFFFNETLYTSYWVIDEWIWILTLVKWPIWKNGHFSTGPPSSGGVGQWLWQKNMRQWRWHQRCWSWGVILQHWHQHWQGRQERMCLMRGTYIGSDGNEIGVLQQWWWWQWCGYNDSINKVRARGWWHWTSTGEARATQQCCYNRSDKGEGKWLSEGARQLSMQAGQKGYNGGAALKWKRQKQTRRVNTILLAPPPWIRPNQE